MTALINHVESSLVRLLLPLHVQSGFDFLISIGPQSWFWLVSTCQIIDMSNHRYLFMSNRSLIFSYQQDPNDSFDCSWHVKPCRAMSNHCYLFMSNRVSIFSFQQDPNNCESVNLVGFQSRWNVQKIFAKVNQVKFRRPLTTIHTMLRTFKSSQWMFYEIFWELFV